MVMPLNTKERQHLKGRAHQLKPVIMVGSNGVTPAVIKEMDRALNDHELIKVRIQGADREARQAMATEIAVQSGAELVQLIGAIGVFYRKTVKK
jgi:RNA-binding protein